MDGGICWYCSFDVAVFFVLFPNTEHTAVEHQAFVKRQEADIRKRETNLQSLVCFIACTDFGSE
jgi:hypothetical protein